MRWLSDAWAVLAGLAGVVAVAVYGWLRAKAQGWREAQEDRAARDRRAADDMRGRVDDARDDVGDDPDSARRWLRERARAGSDD